MKDLTLVLSSTGSLYVISKDGVYNKFERIEEIEEKYNFNLVFEKLMNSVYFKYEKISPEVFDNGTEFALQFLNGREEKVPYSSAERVFKFYELDYKGA